MRVKKSKYEIFATLLCQNHEQNTCRLFHVLAHLSFTTSELELRYSHKKVKLRFAERLKTQDLRKLENFMKILEKLGIGGKSRGDHANVKFRELCQKIAENLL